MIEIEFIDTPDHRIKENFIFHQNEIYLGRRGENFFILDPELKDSHMLIEIIENELIIHPQSGVEFYLIDGKRASTIRKIKTQQKITIGKTTFKINKFEATNFPSKKFLLDSKLALLMEKDDVKLNSIEILAKAMK
jgi:hypothetical protein